jgi:hypothetical protein
LISAQSKPYRKGKREISKVAVTDFFPPFAWQRVYKMPVLEKLKDPLFFAGAFREKCEEAP